MQGDGVDGGRRGDGVVDVRDVPLVRTEGNKYENGLQWSVDHMLRAPQLLRECRNKVARDAERAYGLAPSLYFYVGYPCPAFAGNGDAFVFVFAADTFDGSPGTMTHFDTGGFFLEKIHVEGVDHRAQYVAEHRLDSLAGWRDGFRAYVNEYFASTRAYVRGEPATKRDPNGRLHHPANERRAWTWELQLHDDHDLRRGLLRLWVTAGVYDRLVGSVVGLRDEDERKRWQGVVETCAREPGAGVEASALCRRAQEEIASWL